MDPQSAAFTPGSSNHDIWRLQGDVGRVQQVQAEHSERLARVERKLDEDTRMKSVWGNTSPFPGVLSGTPQQAPLQQPPNDQFRNFDDEANNLMSSLHLDPEEEPRRGMGAASRANSVRFDETANQGYLAHSSRASVDFLSRTSSGLGGLQMNERSGSHKSDGRASSAHSMRSAASGRANSLTGYSFGDSSRSPLDTPGLAPGMLLLGSVPAIIRCWMNTNFKHDTLLYAAVCTGSYRSYLDSRLIQKLGFEDSIIVNDDGVKTVELPVYFPEAVPHPSSSRSSSPAPQLPTLTVDFHVVESVAADDRSIQIFLGSDTLRAHSADILFSSNSISLFDDERSKLSIPLVRPEKEVAFKNLYITSTPRQQPEANGPMTQPQPYLNGLGQGSSGASISSAAASPPPGGKYRPPGAVAAENANYDATKAGAIVSSDTEARPTSMQSNSSARPSLSLLNARPEASNPDPPLDTTTQQTTPLRSGSSPALWGNWRSTAPTSTTTTTANPSTTTTANASLDWASASRNRDSSTPQPLGRRDTGMKVLKPKTAATRSLSSTTSSSATAAPVGMNAVGMNTPNGGTADGRSRFFEEGRQRTGADRAGGAEDGTKKAVGAIGERAEKSSPGPAVDKEKPKTKSNPLGGASAFSWMGSAGRKSRPHPRPPGGSRPSETATTASPSPSQKKRKLGGPFLNNLKDRLHPGYASESESPSPGLEAVKGGALSGLMGGGLKGGHEEGSSPSGRLVELDLGGSERGSFEMIGEQNLSQSGNDGVGGGDGAVRRSHSPAKRSADDMEEVGDAGDRQEAGGSLNNGGTGGAMETDEQPPAYSGQDQANEPTQEQIDEQIEKVTRLAQREPEAGSQGFLISTKWLARVYARSTEGHSSSVYPKEAREGVIGPIDNSDIVVEGAFDEPIVIDKHGEPFIRVRPGVVSSEDYEIMPKAAWELIIGWYHLAHGQEPIVRYAQNTADPPSTNIQYEIFPPVITVRKVPQPGQEAITPPRDQVTAKRLEAERRGRGQLSPEDAARFVSSRQERFQAFLIRTKEAVNTPRSTKVKIWKLLDPTTVATDSRTSATASPSKSRASSPKAESTSTKLMIDHSTFQKMEVGTELEFVDAKDESMNSKYNGKSNMQLLGLFDDTTLLFEEQVGGPGGGEFQSDGKKLTVKKLQSQPASTTASGRTSPAPGGTVTRGRARRDGRTKGTLGLTNLGNTCYMNSALQCIRSVEELALFFLSGRYKEEINANNPLGHSGIMAKNYASVLEGIYSEKSIGAFAPRSFKGALGNCAPLFSGYGQQDSQEFLSFLVDALHEDLNRIQKKPYIENPDSDDKTVHDPQAIIELGNKYRENHSQRNDSIAMDLFNGFYKNTMECSDCDKVSVTFDPYSLLTVQLPIEHTFLHSIAYVPRLGRPVQHQLDIDKGATIRQVKEQIGAKHAIESSRLWLVEVYSHKIYRTFDDDKMTIAEANIQANDHLFLFELEIAPTNHTQYGKPGMSGKREARVPDMEDAAADRMVVSVFSRIPTKTYGGPDPALHPVHIVVTREEAQDYNRVLKKVLVATAQLTSRELLVEEDQASRNMSSSAETAVDGETTSGEESARVSDHSVASEDGMVDVSVNKEEQAQESISVPGPHDATLPANPVPEGFWNDDYFLPPGLQNMFTLSYATIAEHSWQPHNMDSYERNSIRPMYERVQRQPERRGSVDSSSSSLRTSGSSGSRQGNVETEESDVDEATPSLTTGESPSSFANTDEDDEVPHSSTLINAGFENNRSGRQRGGKKDKFAKNKKAKKHTTYGNKRGHKFGNTLNKNQGPRNAQSARSLTGQVVPRQPEPSENQYYIQLGECIVLDWSREAFDMLFMSDLYRSAEDPKRLPKVSDPALEAKQSKRAARKKHGIDLDECFQTTSKPEILTEDNTWYCNRCKEQRRAKKTLEIWTIPDILVVHLKRFGGNRSLRDKIDVFVDYPIEGLDMTERIGCREDGKEYLYDLFAVDNHYGGLGGGHYTAVAKNFYDGQWYDYNDGSCSKTSEARVHSPAAYLLFYRRRSEKPLGPKYLQDLVEDCRNPPPPPEAVEDVTDNADGKVNDDNDNESDSGEARLGDPASSSRLAHGSSSVSLPGAGAAAGKDGQNSVRSRVGGTSAGAGRGAKSAAGMAQTGSNGYVLNQEPATWSFSAVGQEQEEAEEQDAASEADSTTATTEWVEDREGDIEGHGSFHSGGKGNNTPLNGSDYGDRGGAILFDDDNGRGFDEDDPEAVDIHLGRDDDEDGARESIEPSDLKMD